VFDEPTTALDVTTQVEVLISIRKAIEEHRRSGALYHA
jgi:peptide/nickel transport system ATP-binding protein